MANKNLFQTVKGMLTPKADTINQAGGLAYKISTQTLASSLKKFSRWRKNSTRNLLLKSQFMRAKKAL